MYPILYDVCNNCGLAKNSSDISCVNNQTVQWIYHVFHECVDNPKEEVGFILGLVSICCWICASVPQLYENYKTKKVEEAIAFMFLLLWLFGDLSNMQKRRKTEGVSIHLFILAVAGNALYGSSVLLQDPDPGKTYAQFIMQHLPWLVGSLGTMTLDFIALTQILYFNPPCRKVEENEEDTERLIA